MPDYDGRGPAPTTAADVALWVPRVLLFPLYVVSEYVLRRPLGWFVTTAERKQWPAAILDLLTFDRDHKIGVVPTAFVDFGFRPSVGLYFYWDDFAARGNDLRLYGATWGPDWVAASVADRVRLGGASTLTLRTGFVRRKDWVFHGVGPRSLEADRTRYASDAFDVGGRVDARLARAAFFHSAVGYRHVGFGSPAESVDEDPTLGDAVAAGKLSLPPGFVRGYDAVYARLDASVDTRRTWPHEGTGVRLAAEVEPGFDVGERPGGAWVRYAGTAGGYVDLTGTRRVLGVVVHAAFSDPLRGEVPFTELATLGGTGFLRGYRPGRLLGRSAVVAQLEYRWPIWMWLDGSLQLGVGNVFGRALAGLAPELLRAAGSVGVRTSNSADHQFEVLLGGGTETFAQGARLTSVRFFVGATRGF